MGSALCHISSVCHLWWLTNIICSMSYHLLTALTFRENVFVYCNAKDTVIHTCIYTSLYWVYFNCLSVISSFLTANRCSTEYIYWQDIHIRTMRSRRKWWCGSKMTDCTNSRWWYCIEVRKISKCFICINTMQIISITDNMLQEGSSGVWDIRSVTKHLVKWHSAYCIVHSAYAWEALTSITLYFYSSNFFYFLCICESTDFLLYTVFRKKHLLLFS